MFVLLLVSVSLSLLRRRERERDTHFLYFSLQFVCFTITMFEGLGSLLYFKITANHFPFVDPLFPNSSLLLLLLTKRYITGTITKVRFCCLFSVGDWFTSLVPMQPVGDLIKYQRSEPEPRSPVVWKQMSCSFSLSFLLLLLAASRSHVCVTTQRKEKISNQVENGT